ncbi:hypothetical protein J7J08_03575 [Stenotrophomonas sp. ISL-67]|uniref:hypothetical protein n=1 Tax=Stenotrophomonas sp. ISL-67 TaxID=2819171 RepID=UPI001BE7EC74|nr:hypothetical protein [Stenotrophomonas sp. ISL-67]MBT2766708.1 hypothetical protein [Stenotrophomonas sp. ISL-67]
MSFRQFPATDANDVEYVIIEFKDEVGDAGTAADPHVRYELADGSHLVREGRSFRTPGGELTLTV